MKVNCLLQNTQLKHNLRGIISLLVADRIKKNKPAKFPGIFYEIRELGLEVDAETVGAIYNGLYGMYKEDYVSSISEVVAFAGRDVFALMGSITDDVLAGSKPVVNDSTKRTSPEWSATNALAQVFQNAMFGSSEVVKTQIRQMEDLVTRAAKSFLPTDPKELAKMGIGLNANAPKAPFTMTQALDHFFKVEKHTFQRLDGGLNTLETLTNAVKKQVEGYINGIKSQGKLDSGELALLRDQWDQYTEAFINSAYDIFMGKAQQNSLVNLALQQIGKTSTDILDFNGNVKWSLLIKHGNPNSIVDSVKKLFENGVKEKDGTVTKYSQQQAQRIGEYFRKLYMDKLDAAKKRAINNTRLKNNSPVNVISDFVKMQGFFNLVKDKDGQLMLSQADWDAFIKKIKSQVQDSSPQNINLRAELSGTNYIAVQLKKWMDSQLDAKGNPKFDNNKRQIITEKIIDLIVAKLAPNTMDATDIDRLIALNTINGGVAFSYETQHAVNKALGVSDISQAALTKLRGLAQAAAAVMNKSVGTAQVKGQTVNRSAYAFTAVAELDRRIKEIFREHSISKANQQRVFKYMSDLMGGGTVSLLLNPNNVLENPMTQVGTSLTESLSLAFRDPVLFRQMTKGFQKTWGKAWLNYATGGASNELANESELTNELQSSERLRLRTWGEEFKKAFQAIKKGDVKGGMESASSAVIKSPQYFVNIGTRVVMNSFDAATTASLMRKSMVQATYHALLSQGRTPAEIRTLMAAAADISPTVLAEIKTENDRIRQILTDAGIFVTDAMMVQNESDMFLSAYEDIIQDAGKQVGASFKQAAEVTKALIESSQAQSKALGGKQQLQAKDFLSLLIYGSANWVLKPQKTLFENSKKAERRGQEGTGWHKRLGGDMGEAARLQFAGAAYQTAFGKFVGGVANFMALALSATPYGYFMGRSVQNQRNDYAEDQKLTMSLDGGVNVFAVNPEQLRRWTLFHGQMRSLYARAITGSMAMSAFIITALLKGDKDDDDEEDDMLDRFMATKSGRRAVQKFLPAGVAMLVPVYYGPKDKVAALRVLKMFNAYTGADFDKYDMLVRSLSKKNMSAQEEKDIWWRLAGGFSPSYNINQAEQVTKFWDVLQSGMDVKKISAVEWDEERSKEIYKQAEGVMDNLFINGARDAINRGFENRYNNE